MAITIDNKTYRNLEEQVLKNKEDIARHYEIDRVLSDWGIKVLGVYASADLLPTENNEFGDAYGVGITEPYTYYIWTRANTNVGQENDYWLNVGALSIVGPQGPRGNVGPIGPQGVRGSKWFSGTVAPTYIASLHNISDMYINGTTGDVYQLMSNNVWQLFGNIKGPQGVQGPVGPRGIQGIQGPQGPQGAKGDTGASFQIGGLLESSDLLPAPTEANRYIGYAVKNADGITYDLYVVVGTDTLMWVNMGRVEGVEGPQGPIGPQGPAGADIQIVYITGIPATSTQGTLTQDQVNTLLAHPSNYIQFFNENFYPQDVEISEGYIVYSHVGLYEGNTIVKTITLTLATLSWVLTTINVGEAEPPITIVEELPTANEENFEKGKIYTTGELLKYISKVLLSEPNVTYVASLITAVFSAAGAAVGTDIYLFGGSTDDELDIIQKIDTSNNSSEILDVKLPVNIKSMGVAAVGTDIYLFGGYPRDNKIYKFDTITETISTLSTTMPEGRQGVAGAAVGTDIYLFGGSTGVTNDEKTIFKFSTISETITKLSTTLPVGIAAPNAIAVGTDIYVLGGGQTNIYKFETLNNTISTLSTTMPSTLKGTASAAVGTDIYVLGGYDSNSSSYKNTIIKINTTTETVETLATTLGYTPAYLSAVVVGGNIYTIGGRTASNVYVSDIKKLEFGYVYSYKTIATE